MQITTERLDMPDFGSRLSRHRQDRFLTRASLARWCGISERTQEAYENGTIEPNRQYLYTLATAGLDVCYLTTGEFSPAPPGGINPGEFTLLRNYWHSSAEVKADIYLTLMIAAAASHERRQREAARLRSDQPRKAANDD